MITDGPAWPTFVCGFASLGFWGFRGTFDRDRCRSGGFETHNNGRR